MRLFVRLVNLLTAYTAEVEVDVITADARRLLYIMLELWSYNLTLSPQTKAHGPERMSVCSSFCALVDNLWILQKARHTIQRLCAWIFKGGMLNNSPVLTCCCVYSYWISKCASYLQHHCFYDAWIRIIHGPRWLLAASLYINIICVPRLCAALLTCSYTQGSFYWFLEGLHADFLS